jgi:transcriptional regulator with XRE-family HTH domain
MPLLVSRLVMPQYASPFRLLQPETTEYCVSVTLDGWQGRLTAVVAREVRRHRDRRRLSAQQLADRTAEFGMAIPRNVLANLESGRRETITVAEVLVLAAVLGVSPMELICPVGYDAEIEILPGRKMDPLQASRWVDGQLILDGTGPTSDLRAPSLGEESGISLIEQYAAVLDEVYKHDGEIVRSERDLDVARTTVSMTEAAAADAAGRDNDPETAAAMMARAAEQRKVVSAAEAELTYRVSAAEQYQLVAAQSLRFIRAEMRRRGMILPVLPPSLKDTADEPEGDGR